MVFFKRSGCVFMAFLFGLFCLPKKGFSQIENNSIHDTINKDDLGNISDKFQENFFEALTQSAIENPEKAIKALQNCEKIDPGKAVVYFELGKNYFALKNYAQAETNLRQALKKKPGNRAVLTSLYEVYYQTKNYPEAIKTAKQLTDFNSRYYEDLANLFLLDHDYVSALKALDKIDAKKGQSDYRDALRHKILKKSDGNSAPVAYLKKKIAAQPENTRNYADLIYVYSSSDQLEKAFQAAEDLQKIEPDAPQAHVALYKIYRKKGEAAKAVESMKIVLKSNAIGNRIKKNVVEDFSAFVKKHPKYENELVAILGEESSPGHQSNQQLGEYYMGKDNTKAISFFKKALKETPNNFKLIKETLLIEVKENQFADALELSKDALSVFPTQPIFYLLRGVAENGLQDYGSAQETLSTGLDFVIDDARMKADFYAELSKTLKGLNNLEKASEYQKKADNLKTKTTR